MSRLALLVLLLIAPARSAHAQHDPGRARYTDGLALAQREEWSAARDAFEESFALGARPAALYNLAIAEAHCGHVLAALEAYARYETVETDARRLARVRRDLERARGELEARVARLTVRVEGEAARVELDGRAIDAASGAQRLDAGVHVLRALGEEGDERARAEVTLREGDAIEVALVVPEREPPEAAPPIEPPVAEVLAEPVPVVPAILAPDALPSAPERGEDPWPWVLGGTGGALLAVGVVTLVVVLAQPTSPALPEDVIRIRP